MEENEVVMEGDKVKKSGIKKIIIAVVAIIVAILVIVGIVNAVKPTPEKTVKEFLKNLEDKKVSKIVKQIDFYGIDAFYDCDGDYEDFKDEYDSAKDDHEDEIDDYIDEIKDNLEDELDDIDDIKIEIKKMKKAKKVKDAKNLYRVNAKVKVTVEEDDDKNRETSTIDFYVYKKSGKYYIVGMDTKSGEGLNIF